MQVVLATSNKGKAKEISQFFGGNIVPCTDIIKQFDIEEDGDTFAKNATLKAKAIYEKLDKNSIVIADDSGISVPALGGEPGIYSARYAKVGANDKENLDKLIDELKQKSIKRTAAYYTASIALVCKEGEFVVHGWMYGDVIDESRGKGGFGYDPMFIPGGYEDTLGILLEDVKKEFSHRMKALRLMQPILEMIKRGRS